MGVASDRFDSLREMVILAVELDRQGDRIALDLIVGGLSNMLDAHTRAKRASTCIDETIRELERRQRSMSAEAPTTSEEDKNHA